MLELKQEILKIAPDYRGITRSTAMAKALTADELVHAGRRKEAIALFDEAIAGFDDAVKAGAQPDVAREAAVTREKKCYALLMDNDLAGASESLRLASKTIEPMAKLDRKIDVESDAAGVAFERGIMQVVEGRFDEAAANIQHALKVYEAPVFPQMCRWARAQCTCGSVKLSWVAGICLRRCSSFGRLPPNWQLLRANRFTMSFVASSPRARSERAERCSS